MKSEEPNRCRSWMITECDFSPVAGTKLSSYDCNPVFDGGESGVNSVSFYTTEVLGIPFTKSGTLIMMEQ